MLAMIAGVGVVVARTELPEATFLEQASYICAGDVGAGGCTADNAMTRLQNDNGNRTNVTLDEVPPVVVQAVLAVEDRDFYEHDGVNPEGIMRAMFQNVRSGQRAAGRLDHHAAVRPQLLPALARRRHQPQAQGSRAQHQARAADVEGRDPRGLPQHHLLRSRRLRHRRRQPRLLRHRRHGQITDPGQAALLAGLIRAPAAAEPTEHPEEAARRRHTGLVAMEEEGYITAEQLDAGRRHPGGRRRGSGRCRR